MTELLVVIAIIGLLATIAVPTYRAHVERARMRTAQAEMRILAQAQEACAITHGFYVPLQMLDDVIDAGGTTRRDDLSNTEAQIDPHLIDPNRSLAAQVGNQYRLSDRATIISVSRLYQNWGGPFTTFHRVWTGDDFEADIPGVLGEEELARDWPLDPWGNPYRFYSPRGLIGSNADGDDIAAYESDEFGDGELSSGGAYQLDRFAIVSYGPNGIEGNDAGSILLSADPANDDLMYLFGNLPNPSGQHFPWM